MKLPSRMAAMDNAIHRCKMVLKEANGAKDDCIMDSSGDAETTPLQVAAYSGNLNLCRRLIARGADANQVGHNNGYTPLMFAALSGNLEVARLLLEHGAKTSAKNAVDRTAEQVATLAGHHQTAALIKGYIQLQTLLDFTNEFGAQKGVKLRDSCLKDLHDFLNQQSVHPIRVALALRERPALLENASQIVGILRTLRDRFMEPKEETDDGLAIKMHVYAQVLSGVIETEVSTNANGKVNNEGNASMPHEATKGTEKVDLFVRRMLATRESDGYRFALEKFVRRTVQRFPYLESESLQSIVRQIAAHQFGDPDAPSALESLTAGVFSPFFSLNQHEACNVCGDAFPTREDESPTNNNTTQDENGTAESALSSRRLHKCSACRKTLYCSIACQRAHWFIHKRTCGNVRKQRTEERKRKRDRQKDDDCKASKNDE